MRTSLRRKYGRQIAQTVEMKSIYTILFTLLLFSGPVFGQIDRTVIPKPGPAPEIHLGSSKSFILPNGLEVLVFENHKLPSLTLYMHLRDYIYPEGDKAGVRELSGKLLAAGTGKRTKDQIADNFARLGTDYEVTSHSIYVNGLSKFTAANLDIFSDMVQNASFSHREYVKEMSRMKSGYLNSVGRPENITDRVYRQLTFGKAHPYGESISAESIDRITLFDCVDYYSNYWRPNNAVLVVIGDVDYNTLKRMVSKKFSPWKRAEIPNISVPIPNDLVEREVDIIHDPNTQGSQVVISNLAEFELESGDFFPAVFINALLDGNLVSSLQRVGKLKHGANSFLLAPDHLMGSMYYKNASSSERTVAEIKEMVARLSRLRSEKIGEDELRRLKRYLSGGFALSLENPQTQAVLTLKSKLRGVDSKISEQLLTRLAEVTPDDIIRVAQKYIKPEQFRIVVYGDARTCVPPLELDGFKIRYYDTDGNAVGKPSLARPIENGITEEEVIANYIKAMGGRSNMKRVSSVREVLSVDADGKKFEAEILKKNPDKKQTLFRYDNKVFFKRTYNGNMGYTKVGNKRVDLTQAEVLKRKEVKVIFPLLDFGNSILKAELDSLVPIKGHYCYKLRLFESSDAVVNYFISKENGLPLRIEFVKLKEVEVPLTEAELAAQENKEVTTKKVMQDELMYGSNYFNFRSIEGVMFPFTIETMMAGEEMTFEVRQLQLNTMIPSKTFR